MDTTNPSRVSRAVKPDKGGFTLPPYRRVLLILLACAVQMIYLPTSARTTGGIEPRLPIDIFPIWPVWILPYMACYLLWALGVTWTILKMDDRHFRSWIAACLFTFGVSVCIFIFFPTYVSPAALEENDLFTSLLRSIHENWGRYDAFPSGHVYITTLLALFFNRWYPHQRFIWALVLILVSLSTLFTGQHYLLDVFGGYLVAFAGYQFGLWWAGYLPRKFPESLN